MTFSSRPIGIFDSGIGGFTVLQEIAHLLPQENFIYFADAAHMPYGNKSPEVILQYSLECAASLVKKDIKCLVIACHTASAYALDALQKQLPIPVIGMIQPSIESLMDSTKNLNVAILGTEGTIRSNVYQRLIQIEHPQATTFPIACPLLASLIEKGVIDHPHIKKIINRYLSPLQDIAIDTALLACTHYPLIREIIQEELGAEVVLIDPAKACARAVWRQLDTASLLNTQKASDSEIYAYFS